MEDASNSDIVRSKDSADGLSVSVVAAAPADLVPEDGSSSKVTPKKKKKYKFPGREFRLQVYTLTEEGRAGIGVGDFYSKGSLAGCKVAFVRKESIAHISGLRAGDVFLHVESGNEGLSESTINEKIMGAFTSLKGSDDDIIIKIADMPDKQNVLNILRNKERPNKIAVAATTKIQRNNDTLDGKSTACQTKAGGNTPCPSSTTNATGASSPSPNQQEGEQAKSNENVGLPGEYANMLELLNLDQAANIYHENFALSCTTDAISTSFVDTYQGRIETSENGCIAISSLLCLHHVSPDPTPSEFLSDEVIENVIDVEAPKILETLWAFPDYETGSFIEPSCAINLLRKEKRLNEKQFGNVVGGNILDPADFLKFIRALHLGADELTTKYQEASSKTAALFFFNEHGIAILKDGCTYLIIDSLPASQSGLFGEEQSKTLIMRCRDIVTLELCLLHYVFSNFSADDMKYISENDYSESNGRDPAKTEPRIFEGWLFHQPSKEERVKVKVRVRFGDDDDDDDEDYDGAGGASSRGSGGLKNEEAPLKKKTASLLQKLGRSDGKQKKRSNPSTAAQQSPKKQKTNRVGDDDDDEDEDEDYDGAGGGQSGDSDASIRGSGGLKNEEALLKKKRASLLRKLGRSDGNQKKCSDPSTAAQQSPKKQKTNKQKKRSNPSTAAQQSPKKQKTNNKGKKARSKKGYTMQAVGVPPRKRSDVKGAGASRKAESAFNYVQNLSTMVTAPDNKKGRKWPEHALFFGYADQLKPHQKGRPKKDLDEYKQKHLRLVMYTKSDKCLETVKKAMSKAHEQGWKDGTGEGDVKIKFTKSMDELHQMVYSRDAADSTEDDNSTSESSEDEEYSSDYDSSVDGE